MRTPLAPRRRYRLLALDIDGTLLRSDKSLSSRTRAAVDAARARGVHLVLVTGRRYPSARLVAEDLGGDVPLVLHNGALILDVDGGDAAILRCRPLPRALALEAAEIGRRRGADPVVHCGQRGEGRLLVGEGPYSSTLLAYYLDRSHPDVTACVDFEQALLEDPLQVMFGGRMADMAALLPELREALGGRVKIERTVYPAQDVGLLDVLERTVGKAEALAFLQERWEVAADETLAIGDNWNDREMLENAGLGLVMGNADPGMHALGLPVLPTTDDDGVAVAIEEYVL
ncbi:MAG TPA: HAD family hydrolase [Vicinamibacteria bacterium]|nr:HAD family hydrolase [Vicinamibacteria bacterium]